LLNDFGEDFYGEELRLAIVGYIRPEVIHGHTIFIVLSTDSCSMSWIACT
jgi:hypothetical protein